MKIKWIKHACFQIQTGSTIIYLDPYEIPTGSPKADIIFASHDHYDHFDETAIKSVAQATTQVVCPASCKPKAGNLSVTIIKPGDNGKIGHISFEAVPAYNPTKKFHPKANNWVGYVITIEGKKIYHAGDTDYIPEFENLKGKIDVAMLPVGDTYTMGFADAIKANGTIQPKIMIPMHDWDKNLKEFKQNSEKLFPNTKVEILKDHDFEI